MQHFHSISFLLLISAGSIAETSPSAANSLPISFDLSVGYDSEYYYRGLWSSNQNAWYNIGAASKISDTTNINALAYYTSSNDRRSLYQELDLGAVLTHDAGFATLKIGYTYFFFFNGYSANGTGQTFAQEFWASVSKPIGTINVTATYAYDLYVDAGYAEIAFDKTFSIATELSLVLAINTGYSFGGYYTLFDAYGYNIGTESV